MDGTLQVTLEPAILVAAGKALRTALVPKIYNLTGPVRDMGGAILCFVGPPWKSVDWRLLEGLGTVTPFTTYTDELGRASARFDAAGITGRTVIAVAYVP